ncbi:hypothetical protein ACI2LJ_30635 [Streptomyces sp. NPDC088090]|uniref:hypothetical protein n=1 Tax=Streptomyces sp. NPDC088090 TaxID=3365822 RepID=UPI0038506C24
MQDEERGWLIPVDALLAAGFRLNAPAPPEDASASANPAAASGSAVPGAAEAGEDVAGLRAELERERHARALEVAEARHLRDQLAARDGHIEDLRSALRALSPAAERTALGEPGHQAPGGGVVVPGQGHPEPPAPSSTSASTAAGTAAGDGARRRR